MLQPADIRFIFFDLGKVLVDYDWNIAARHMAQKSPMPESDILQHLFHCDYRLLYEKGLITTVEFIGQLQKDLCYRGSPDELETLWCDIFTPMTANIETMKRLLRNYPLGLISNTCASHIHWIQKHFDILNNFNPLIYSYEVHAVKPDPEIFITASRHLALRPDEILFIDDTDCHIATARDLGWQTIHLTPATDLSVRLIEKKLLFRNGFFI